MIFSENRCPLFRIMLSYLKHDLFGKPGSTFPDHAFTSVQRRFLPHRRARVGSGSHPPPPLAVSLSPRRPPPPPASTRHPHPAAPRSGGRPPANRGGRSSPPCLPPAF